MTPRRSLPPLALLLLLNCSDDAPAGGAVDQGADLPSAADMAADLAADMGDPAQAACRARCQALSACGALAPDADCTALCATLADTSAYTATCAACGAGACAMEAACLTDPMSACGAPPVQLSVVVSGARPDTALYGRLKAWDGTRAPAFAEVVTGDTGTGILGYGRAIHAGVRYEADYFLDINGDGFCEPGVDETGQAQVFAEGDTVVTFQYHTHVPANGALCAGFPSRTTLCAQRCARAEACVEEEAGPGCQSSCEADPVAVTVACIACMDGSGCAEQRARCRTPGGVCRRDFVPPDATLLAGTSGLFNGQQGTPVVGIVRHMSGRTIASAEPVEVREDGGFLLRYGMTVWRGQIYTVLFYLDSNRDGTCSSTEPAYKLDIQVPQDSALLYKIFTPDELTRATCDEISS